MTTRATAGLVGAGLAAPLVAVSVLAAAGALAAPGGGLPDPGPLVRAGLPVAAAVRDLAAALTAGLLVTAATLLPGPGPRQPGLGPRQGRDVLTPLQHRTTGWAAVAAAAWTTATVVGLLFTYADLAGSPLGVGTVAALPYFVTDFDLGRALGLSAAGSLLAGLLAATTATPGRLGAATVLAVAAVLPLAWTGHGGSSLNHATAIDAQMTHLVGVSVWVGGLAALTLLRSRLGGDLAITAGRFSVLAGWCYGLVAAGGLAGAVVRLPDPAAVTGTSYGQILLGKAIVLTALGIVGWYHRRRLLPQLSVPGRRGFARLAAGELMLMGAAVGLGVALGRTSQPDAALAETLPATTALLGYPMPPPLTLTTIFTAWRPDPLWLPLAGAAAVCYLLAVRRLRRRHIRWPLARTVAFLLGCVLLIAATSGSPGVYGQVLFSMHMVQHMTIATAVPAFLVLGAPITVALRALPARTDGSRGPREWLLAVVGSRYARLLSNPLIVIALFLGSLVAFYYTPALEFSLRTHIGHLLMLGHFLLVGYLFANIICGIDPGPARPPHLFRLMLLIVTFGFHAFFAVSLLSGSALLAESWYASLDRDWGPSLAADQALGVALSWALGDYPIAILAVALIVSWVADDTREARRYDRQADRDGDAELTAYNTHLQRLHHLDHHDRHDRHGENQS
jgi:cytochrome c oxidase assembly factor CtaG/putative copper export protein